MEREQKPVFLCKSRDGRITYSADDKFIYAEKDGKLHRLDIFDHHYYKLRLWNDIPILEIDGLRMQLVKDFETPLDYAREVVAALHIPSAGSAIVLDTCMGLGYTAMEAAKNKGVKKVISCEVAGAVITLANWNPMSEGLFENGKIKMLHGNIADLTSGMKDNSVDFIIHDPPRFSHAPELYSPEFYKELFRIAKAGARIFHYVGSAGKSKGKKMEAGVSKRLEEAGFANISYNARLQGLFFKKKSENPKN